MPAHMGTLMYSSSSSCSMWMSHELSVPDAHSSVIVIILGKSLRSLDATEGASNSGPG